MRSQKKLLLAWVAIAGITFFLFVFSFNAKAAPSLFSLSFSSSKLFNVSNAAPGDSFSKNFTVINNEGTEKSLHIYSREVGNINLKEMLGVSITGGSSPLNLSMEDFLALPDIDVPENKFDVLGPNETKQYSLTIVFDPSAGNVYQGKTLTFDITFGVIKSGSVLSATTTENGDVLGRLTSLPNTGGDIVLLSLGLILAGYILKRVEKLSRKIFQSKN